jgi:hypothetical protein
MAQMTPQKSGPGKAMTEKVGNVSVPVREKRAVIERVRVENSRPTFGKVSVLPTLMFFCFGGLLVYFRSRGGYR